MVVIEWTGGNRFTWLALFRHWSWSFSLLAGHWVFDVRNRRDIYLVLISGSVLRLDGERVLPHVHGESTFNRVTLYLLPRRLEHFQLSVYVVEHKSIVRLFKKLFNENRPVVGQALVRVRWWESLSEPTYCLLFIHLCRVGVFILRLDCFTTSRCFLVGLVFTRTRSREIVRYFVAWCMVQATAVRR